MGIENLSTIWPGWKVVDKIGEGSYGKVYEIMREEHGITFRAAVKVISIPESEAELESLYLDGLDASAIRAYFEEILADFLKEIKLLDSVKGASATKATAKNTGGKAVDLTPQATRSGWQFVGWNTDKNATSALTSHTMPTSNLTLYAIYRKNLTATFKDYSATTLTTRTDSKTIYNKATNATITVPAQNTYTGWTSRGWSTATTANAGAMTSSGPYTISADTTFYGLYQRELILSYTWGTMEVNGLKMPASQKGTQYTSSYNISNYANPTLTVAAPIGEYHPYTSYGFVGWSESRFSSQTYKVGQDITISDNKTLFSIINYGS